MFSDSDADELEGQGHGGGQGGGQESTPGPQTFLAVKNFARKSFITFMYH